MKIGDTHYRTIWVAGDGWTVEIIDQTKLPHRFEVAHITTLEEAACAIEKMLVRGAPLIGAMAAYGVALALRISADDVALAQAIARLEKTRPTAVNLRWALRRMRDALSPAPVSDRVELAYATAATICDEDVEICENIGRHGLELIKDIAHKKPAGQFVNILTHCNAGWLATIDWGTAIAPIYKAHEAGIPVHVWVDETRPRNQGAALTAYELGGHGIPHTIIVDNAGGHLMQHSQVDLCITGTDRTAANGDVANKIGTYLKALAARDNGVPFYVALPSPTIDWQLTDGFDIPIEERGSEEITQMTGRNSEDNIVTINIAAKGSPAANPAFDVTPARLVTGLITERGICPASRDGLADLFPEQIG